MFWRLAALSIITSGSLSLAAQTVTLNPSADAYVRDGNYADNNYGNDTSLTVKGSPYSESGFTRQSYIKFSLPTISKVGSAKLRIYGLNTDNTSDISISVFGIGDDSWTESGITFNNAPPVSTGMLGSTDVNNVPGYYDFDITSFVVTNLNADKVVSIVLKDIGYKDKSISFSSNNNAVNKPLLVIDTTFTYSPGSSTSHPMLFVENPDHFPSNSHFVFSTIQIPWTRDSVYNGNHDSLKVKIRNNGLDPLVVTGLSISDTTLWEIEKVNGNEYNPAIQLPSIISSGSSLDVIVKFIAKDVGSRAKVVTGTLTIISDDERYPVKMIYFDGLWQNSGEGVLEPHSDEIFATFGYKTQTGFGGKDPDLGDSTKLKGDEIKPSYFVRSDTTIPVTVRQLAAYHNCCHSVETFKWFYKGTTVYNALFPQIGLDGQTLLPRRSTSSTYYPSEGTISPTGASGVYIGVGNTTDAA
ncbi:MAG: DNRLRE domain-containing protein, partial [Dyadobacter sp.]